MEQKKGDEMKISKICEDFINGVVPTTAPKGQREDMKVAFMSGAYSLYMIQMKMSLAGGEELSMEIMNNIAREFKDFFELMQQRAKAFESGADLSNIKMDLG